MASKTDVARIVAQTEHTSVKDASSIIETTLGVIAELTKTGKVTIVGFGTFERKLIKERQGRNPRTGEAITIPARIVMRFHPSKSLVDVSQEKELLGKPWMPFIKKFLASNPKPSSKKKARS